MVVVTDGLPAGADIGIALFSFHMPILNVVVIRFFFSPARSLKITLLICNLIWIGLAGWLIVSRYPSHPQ